MVRIKNRIFNVHFRELDVNDEMMVNRKELKKKTCCADPK